MWDVIWTDPDRELVGEHRARKERTRGTRSDASSIDHQHASSRSSLSTQSSVSSSDAGLSFLRSQKGSFRKEINGKGKGKEIFGEGKSSWRSNSWSKASSTASSAIASLSISSARSPLSPTFDVRSRRSSGLATTNDSSLHSRPSIASRVAKEIDAVEEQLVADAPHPGKPNYAESVNPEGKEPSLKPDEHIVRQPDCSLHREDSESPSVSPLQDAAKDSQTITSLLTEADAGSQSEISAFSPLFPTPRSYLPPAVPPKSPLRPNRPNHALATLPDDPDDWLPPGEWSKLTTPSPIPEKLALRDDSRLLNAETLRVEIDRMQITEPVQVHAILEDMCRNQGSVQHELTKKRWLLAALQQLDCRVNPFATEDTSNTAAYFAALHPERNFYHVARHPLHNATFANVIPITLSSLSAEILSPALPNQLDHIFTLSLPSLCAAPELVRTLNCLRSCLKPEGGTLNLTLIDAMPHPATLGPHLRSWFEKNLIVNLPPYSLSHNPTRLFPRCLAAASLRGLGSKRVKTKFFASSESIRRVGISEEEQQHEDHDPDPAIRRLRAELRVKAELRCLVGRMLWMEVWGSHVSPRVGRKGTDCNDEGVVPWWWDDEVCMAECLQFGTFWEYHTIETVRGP
ncbi:hypothetical protein LIA77_05745 [Sarocladium implicatum]|nr:hypothetical protein LIA77_05745 [Sarocladium implicatum]